MHTGTALAFEVINNIAQGIVFQDILAYAETLR